MKVYVESKYIPEKCSKCKFIGHYENGMYSRNPHCCCELYWDLHQDEIRVNKNSRDERCPLQSLADYTNQVRKEALGDLMNMLGDRAELIDIGNGCVEFMFTTYDLQECSKEILDTKQGETK